MSETKWYSPLLFVGVAIKVSMENKHGHGLFCVLFEWTDVLTTICTTSIIATLLTPWHWLCNIWVCFSVPSIAGEHLPIPGHDNAEGPQDDSGGQTWRSHSARRLHQSAHLHHGCQPNISDVRAPWTVRRLKEWQPGVCLWGSSVNFQFQTCLNETQGLRLQKIASSLTLKFY